MGSILPIEVRIPSSHGETVRCLLIEPRESSAPAPAVLFFHPASGDVETFLDDARIFADAGLASLLIEAPFRRRVSDAATLSYLARIERQGRDLMQALDDARSGIDWLSSRPGIDSRQLAAVGKNWG